MDFAHKSHEEVLDAAAAAAAQALPSPQVDLSAFF
jgi:hypothetical protein